MYCDGHSSLSDFILIGYDLLSVFLNERKGSVFAATQSTYSRHKYTCSRGRFWGTKHSGAKLLDSELLCEDNSSEKCVSSVVYSRKINLEIMEV